MENIEFTDKEQKALELLSQLTEREGTFFNEQKNQNISRTHFFLIKCFSPMTQMGFQQKVLQ